jgi:3-deoxy-D-manno-octulosonic-acid transferase
MYFLYSLLYSIGFILMSPLFLLRQQKYASGFRERLGNYPEFKHDDREIIWLHCVSVGETNAARPLVDKLIRSFPNHRLIVSTTTRTGQDLAKKIFAEKADAVFYFPFDWKFSVCRALNTFRPSLLLLMETEIWPRLIAEAKGSGARIAIVNGRLSEKSYWRYSLLTRFICRVLKNIDLALMQSEKDAERIKLLGIESEKIHVTGNLKFDLSATAEESLLTEEFRGRFGIDGSRPLVVAASTHEPEEKWVLESLKGILGKRTRLLIAPRHPERFDAVARLIRGSGYTFTPRSDSAKAEDKLADIILLDSIGELRAVYPLADIVFVGGSLIPHGGQNILEPAAAGCAIITGWSMFNFERIVKEFVARNALVQLRETKQSEIAVKLHDVLSSLLADRINRERLGRAGNEIVKEHRGAAAKTVWHLKPLIPRQN